MRGVLRLQFAKNEARLVPILHNGRVPPPECICPPRVQLTLVTKGIMDIRFQYGESASLVCRLLWEQECFVGSNPTSPTNLDFSLLAFLSLRG